jgi:hypothetical protein
MTLVILSTEQNGLEDKANRFDRRTSDKKFKRKEELPREAFQTLKKGKVWETWNLFLGDFKF